MWRDRYALWPGGVPDPIGILEPQIAAKALGVDFMEREELGGVGSRATPYEIAGLIDRQANQIAISKRFPTTTNRFTAAHELGHWILHPRDFVMHRDRPISGLRHDSQNRPPKEREADHFSACFLMPRRLVRSVLEATFSIQSPFIFDDNSAFWLGKDDPDALLRPIEGSLAQGLALASAESYGGGPRFISLAERFRVSVTTMAIRLEELNLIK